MLCKYQLMKSYLIRFSFLLVCSIIILQHSSFDAFNIPVQEIEDLSLLEGESDAEFESKIDFLLVKSINFVYEDRCFTDAFFRRVIIRSNEIEVPPPQNLG